MPCPQAQLELDVGARHELTIVAAAASRKLGLCSCGWFANTADSDTAGERHARHLDEVHGR